MISLDIFKRGVDTLTETISYFILSDALLSDNLLNQDLLYDTNLMCPLYLLANPIDLQRRTNSREIRRRKRQKNGWIVS